MGIKLSYSGVKRFKTCPQKYYHYLKYSTKTKPSAFAFGDAIEEGVSAILLTKELDRGLATFTSYWENEKGDKNKPVLDNPNIEYYASDYDKTLVLSNDSFISNSFEELELNEIYDSWLDAMEEALTLKKNKDFAPKSILEKFMNRVFWWSCRLKGIVMLESFYDQVFPDIEEVIMVNNEPAIQVKISMENDEGDSLIGYIDYILKFKGREKSVITDCKTASMPYTEHDIKTSDQLRTYVAAVKDEYEEDCDAAYLVLGKKLQKVKYCASCKETKSTARKRCGECKEELQTSFRANCQVLFTSYSDEMLEDELQEYENILTSINSNVIFKNTDSCMAYNRPCEFYDLCWNNKTVQEIDHLMIKESESVKKHEK